MSDSPAAGPWAAPDRPGSAGGGGSDWSGVGATGRWPGTAQPTTATGSVGSPGTGGPTVTPVSVPLRPLELGDILDGTFSTIRRNPRATLGLAALLVTVQELLILAAQLLTGDLPTAGLDTDQTMVRIGPGVLIGLVISAVVGAVLTGMIVVVVFDDVLGRPTSAGQVWRRVRPRIGALLVAAVLAGVLPYLGLALLVVPGVLLWGCWALTTPALVLEGLGPAGAVRRSWRLAWPAFWRTWSVRALSVLLGNIMRLLVAVPFTLVAVGAADLGGTQPGAPIPGYALAVVALGAIVAGTLVEPFYAGVLALLYLDRRMRAEGFDIAMSLANRAQPNQPDQPGLLGRLGTAPPIPAGAHPPCGVR